MFYVGLVPDLEKLARESGEYIFFIVFLSSCKCLVHFVFIYFQLLLIIPFGIYVPKVSKDFNLSSNYVVCLRNCIFDSDLDPNIEQQYDSLIVTSLFFVFSFSSEKPSNLPYEHYLIFTFTFLIDFNSSMKY